MTAAAHRAPLRAVAQIEQPVDFLRYVVVQADDLFLLWSVLGGLVAALVFSLTVVSVPMLVDRDVRTPQALFTSLRAVGENPVTMVWWALFLLFATGFSVATLMLGFLVLFLSMDSLTSSFTRLLGQSLDVTRALVGAS